MTTKADKPLGLAQIRMVAIWVGRWETWLGVAGVALVVGLLWWVSGPFAGLMSWADQTREWVLSFGSFAPLAYVTVFVLQIVVAPLPGQLLGVMGGYLFGMFAGSLYSITGLVVGAGLAMWLARRFGRPWLERCFPATQLRVWERKLRTRSLFTWWLLFVVPVPDLVFYAAGLSSVSLRRLLVALVFGRGLGLVFANVLGYWTAHLSPEWVLVKWSVIAAAAVVAYIYQRPLRWFVIVNYRRLRRWRRRGFATR